MAFGSVLTIEQDAPVKRKARGAFFTPPALCDLLCSWAIRSASDRVLEPSTGEGQFLVSAATALRSLAQGTVPSADQLCGYELHAPSAAIARERLGSLGFAACIKQGSFLDVPAQRSFDAVVGNPPYVRFQALGAHERASYRELMQREGVEASSLSSLWAPFVVHAAQFLKPGGRLALVLPAELLTVNYAAPVRSYLLRSFSSITIETFYGRVFPEVQEEVVLLFADGCGLGSSREISWRMCETLDDLRVAPLKRFAPQVIDGRWSAALAPDAARGALERLEDAGDLAPLSRWGSVSLGAVTGDNAFFALSEEERVERGIPLDGVIPLCPSGSKHLLAFSIDYELAASWRARGMRTWLFHPQGAVLDELSPASRAYVELGLQRGVADRYKCRTRSPWWRVPLGKVPDAFFTYMNAFAPRLCANSTGLVNLNSVHGISFHGELRELGMRYLPLAAWNSATLLSAELEGRAYGGGVLKLEPREAARLLLPSPQKLDALRPALDGILEEASQLLRERRFDALVRLVDTVVLARGFDLDEREMAALREAHGCLRSRRVARAKGVDDAGR